MPTLTILTGLQSGATISLKDKTVIGRSRSADLQFEEKTLSRQHAKIELSDGHWRITDLGSSNGTFVNDTPGSSECIDPGWRCHPFRRSELYLQR